MVRYLFYTIGDLTYQSPLVLNTLVGIPQRMYKICNKMSFNKLMCTANPTEFLITEKLEEEIGIISTTNISWGKGCRCVGPTNLTPLCADCLEI